MAGTMQPDKPHHAVLFILIRFYRLLISGAKVLALQSRN
jgi:hypothetical protein